MPSLISGSVIEGDLHLFFFHGRPIQRIDPSAVDNFAIRMASRNGHLDVVRILLEDERVVQSGGYARMAILTL